MCLSKVCVLEAEDMINSVRTAFKENLKDLDWMDPETRQLAMDKADAITDMIGECYINLLDFGENTIF